MKHQFFALFLIFLCISISVKAQQNHFIYIQTDNKQPFYVRQDKNVYSSTASGYLVLSKLKTGSYDLVFGFPKNEWPEQNIHCSLEDKDLGYLLKNFGEKGWGLFNLQSLSVLMANENSKKSDVAKEVRTDAFSNMLSTVVNDPTIKENEPVKQEVKKTITEDVKPSVALNSESKKEPLKKVVKEEPKNESVKATELATTNVSLSSEPPKEQLKKATKEEPKIESVKITEPDKINIAVNSAYKKEEIKGSLKDEPKIDSVKSPESVTLKSNENTKKDHLEDKVNITKKLANKTAEGMEMVYVDMANGIQDTVRILIPVEKEILENSSEKNIVSNKPKEDIRAKEANPVIVAKDEKKKETKFLEIELPNPNGKVNDVRGDSIRHQNIPQSQIINSDCKNFATNEDFLKLRKKMAAVENPDDMIVVSKKFLKTKCFTTEQLKNLSVLFLSDAGKYSFFDAAYPFVSDSQNYIQLESQLTETYYINRFKVMVKH